jgi:cell fate (sporulation/competence/biofilm development) regulator YmcA (YheA/YmcA/DUF963 family)
MTENSTKSQADSSTQNPWESLAKMVDSLLKAVKELPSWAQFGAFFLVVILIATVVVTLSLSSDVGKLQLIFVFLSLSSLFVALLYAFSLHQTKLENNTTSLKQAINNLKELGEKLQLETNERIKVLQFTQNQLKDIEKKLQELPLNAEIESLMRKTDSLLRRISGDLEAIAAYDRDLATARGMEERIENPDRYKKIAAKFSDNLPAQAEESR